MPDALSHTAPSPTLSSLSLTVWNEYTDEFVIPLETCFALPLFQPLRKLELKIMVNPSKHPSGGNTPDLDPRWGTTFMEVASQLLACCRQLEECCIQVEERTIALTDEDISRIKSAWPKLTRLSIGFYQQYVRSRVACRPW